MDEAEKAEQEKAEREETATIAAIELEDTDNDQIEGRLKDDHAGLVGPELETKRKEFQSEARSAIHKKAQVDGKLFEEIKKEDDWNGKEDDEIWEEVENRNISATEEGRLKDLLGPKASEKNKGKGKEKGEEVGTPDEEVAELKAKLVKYEAAYADDSLLKAYVTATVNGTKKKMVELLQSDPLITLDLNKTNGKSLYETHLNTIRVEHGDSIMTEQQIIDKVTAFDELEPEEKVVKIDAAKAYLKVRQDEQREKMGATLESEGGDRKVDTKAIAKSFSDAFEAMKGTTQLGVKMTPKVVDAVFDHIKTGKFDTHDPETKLPIPERVIRYAMLDLYESEMARTLYGAGKRDAELRNKQVKHRSKSLYHPGSVRTTPGKSDWDKLKRNEDSAKVKSSEKNKVLAEM